MARVKDVGSSAERCDHLRSEWRESHRPPALGADKDLIAEISFDPVDLIDQGELVEPEFFGCDLKCSVGGGLSEAL